MLTNHRGEGRHGLARTGSASDRSAPVGDPRTGPRLRRSSGPVGATAPASAARGPKSIPRLIGVLVAIGLAPAAALAQLEPVGPELPVNTQTQGLQLLSRAPGVSSDGGDGFVVVWETCPFLPLGYCTNYDVHGQRFDGSGQPAGGEFLVNAWPFDDQQEASVSPDGSGGFVVVWMSTGSLEDPWYGIRARRYTSAGAIAGPEMAVNAWTNGRERTPAVSLDGTGGYVIAWDTEASGGPDSSLSGIAMRRFASDGTPIGTDFQVNQYTTSFQREAAVSPTGAGGFVVAWESRGSYGTDDDEFSIQARLFGPQGDPLGDQFQVNATTAGWQCDPAVAPDGSGGVVVAYSSWDWPDPTRVLARRIDASGSPIGAEIEVGDHAAIDAFAPSLAADPAGGFVVAWASVGSPGDDGYSSSVQARAFAADGAPVGAQVQVNVGTTLSELPSGVSPDGAGGFVVAWTRRADGLYGPFDGDVAARRVQAGPGGTAGIFADGFESGDLGAWSLPPP